MAENQTDNNYEKLFKGIEKEEKEKESKRSKQVEWNFDNAEGYLIFQIKSDILDSLNYNNPDLKEAYAKIRQLWLESDAVYEPGERKEMHDLINKFDELKIKFQRDENEYGSYFSLCEQIYLRLCQLLQLHGVYFRKIRGV